MRREFLRGIHLGRADGGNASVIYVDKSELSFQCSGNGILDTQRKLMPC